MTIAAHAREHHYSAPYGANVTHSSPRGRRRDDAQRLQARLRLSRHEWERHPAAIALGVPDGSVRAAGPQQWIADCRAHSALAHLRSDAWDSALSVVRSLANRTDWQLGTARPTWAVLMADTGLSRRTIARYLALLRAAGLLGVVATGRTAAATPMALDDGVNAAAVYVLTVPHVLQLVIGGRQDQPEATNQQHQDAAPADPAPALTSTPTAVDELGTPSPSPLVTGKEQPTHARCAREEKPKAARASSPSSIRDLTRAQLIAAGQLCDGSEKALWTTKGRRLFAAAELRRRDPILGRASTADVASMLREWLLTQEWSITDIHHAINHRPDGTPWPHQLTVADVGDVRGFVRYRLNAWRTDPLDHTSAPGRSPSARAEAEQRRARARAQVRAEADAAARAARMTVEDRSPAAEADMAAAKARLRRATLTRKHRQA